MYSAVERRTNGNLRYKYVYANGMLLSRIDSAGTTYYYSHDALGSVIGASSSSAVYKSFLYDEFGDSLGAWGATSINNYRYTGQEYDWTPVNAYNLRAREYYPKLGRFMQNDPIGDKGGNLNWYAYVANNPINWADITGLYCGSQGNDAAIPDFIEYAFNFEIPCIIHDECYGKCNASKLQCDYDFLQNMRYTCQFYPFITGYGSTCNFMAELYFLSVYLGGDEAFRKAQCNCHE